eukprot:c6314_g1_i1 orf=107-925(+)
MQVWKREYVRALGRADEKKAFRRGKDLVGRCSKVIRGTRRVALARTGRTRSPFCGLGKCNLSCRTILVKGSSLQSSRRMRKQKEGVLPNRKRQSDRDLQSYGPFQGYGKVLHTPVPSLLPRRWIVQLENSCGFRSLLKPRFLIHQVGGFLSTSRIATPGKWKMDCVMFSSGIVLSELKQRARVSYGLIVAAVLAIFVNLGFAVYIVLNPRQVQVSTWIEHNRRRWRIIVSMWCAFLSRRFDEYCLYIKKYTVALRRCRAVKYLFCFVNSAPK